MWEESNEITYKKINLADWEALWMSDCLQLHLFFIAYPFLSRQLRGSSKGLSPIKFCIVAHGVGLPSVMPFAKVGDALFMPSTIS